jgi:hypothetical protein
MVTAIGGDALDPRTFGCPCDGIHDDLPGWLAMMATVPIAGAATVALPNSNMFFSDDLFINRNLKIRGNAGGGETGGSNILMPAGKSVYMDNAAVNAARGGDGGSAEFFEFTNVTIYSAMMMWTQANDPSSTGGGGPAFGHNTGPVGLNTYAIGGTILSPMGGQRVDATFYGLGHVMARGHVANVTCFNPRHLCRYDTRRDSE